MKLKRWKQSRLLNQQEFSKHDFNNQSPHCKISRMWLLTMIMTIHVLWTLLVSLVMTNGRLSMIISTLPSPPSSFPVSPQSLRPPRNMSASNNTIYFLHVGKTGGTSVDHLMQTINKRQGRIYRGFKHYDWSWIKERGDPDEDADVITFLRHPVSRVVSQFRFSKTLRWAKNSNATFLYQTIDEYLTNPGQWGQFTRDGVYCNYLSGANTGKGSVATDGNKTERKQYLREHMAENAIQAANNLDKTVYFGMLEDIPRSMKMLQLTLGLKKYPLFPRKNVLEKRNKEQNLAKQHDSGISVETAVKVESKIPGDLWLYEYAKLLFEARWDYFTGKTDHYKHPRFPPLPKSLQ